MNDECGSIEFFDAGGFVKAVYKGRFSVQSCMNAWNNHFTNESWRPGKNILIDFCQTDFGDCQIDDFRRRVFHHAERQEDLGGGRIAYFVCSRVNYGRVRQIQMLTEVYLQNELGIFTDLNKAIGWLSEKVSPAVLDNRVPVGARSSSADDFRNYG